MSQQHQNFTDALGFFLPAAEQMQKQFQTQMQQAMQMFGTVNPALLTGSFPASMAALPAGSFGVMQPFMQSVFEAYQSALSQISVQALSQVQTEYTAELSKLMASAFSSVPGFDQIADSQVPLDAWIEGDRRFASTDWRDKGVYEFMAALYLLNSKYTKRVVDLLPEDSIEKRRLGYSVDQVVDALSPSNFFVTNPEAQKKVLETKGESLRLAMENLFNDLQKGRISQTDEAAFEVGKNVAVTPGSVVFENHYFQLIQYQPTTAQVGSVPMLFVPPCINKFYILDLQPENSMVRFVVDQGHPLFLVSWKNPSEAESNFTWDGYVEEGVITAINVVKAISAQPKVNMMGFCIGGTLVSTALSTLATRSDDSVNSLTLLTTLLDFTDSGTLGVFVTEDHVRMREESIGKGGLLSGKELASAFSFLRPNDLVWNYVVNNYLKGEAPPVFDILYWNSDSTNLAGPMYAWYLRNTYLDNKLCHSGAVNVCGEPVDLSLIDVPTYVFAAYEDHIVPWRSAYATCPLLSGDVRFVLGASGHIAGVINPVSKDKRNFWVYDGDLPETPDAWKEQAESKPGSWWKDWSAWLASKKGDEVKAPAKLGNAAYKPIEAAPGRYVKSRV